MDGNMVPTIITVSTVLGGLIAQAAYLKGSFTEKIGNNSKSIDKIDKEAKDRQVIIDNRLSEGQKTFSGIRESIATTTGSLTVALNELTYLRNNSMPRSECGVNVEGMKQRVTRLEKEENGK